MKGGFPYGGYSYCPNVLGQERNSDQRVCDEIWYILYVHCTEYSAESGGCRRMCQRHLASRVERYAAAPAVSVIHISWKITRNLSFDLYRKCIAKTRRKSDGCGIGRAGRMCFGKDDIERQWEMKELIAEINQFLQKLPEEKRCMFVLRYWYVDSIGEIAERLGRSENYISVSLNRIRGKLHIHLTERGFEL